MSNASDFIIKKGVLTKYVGSDGDVVIPEGITSIQNEAFYKCTALRSVSVPAGTKKIGERVFYGCENLVTVSLPETLQSVALACFGGCKSLKRVAFPESIKVIESRIFVDCHSLEEVVFPVDLETLAKDVFVNCNKDLKIYCSGKAFSSLDKVSKDNVTLGWLTGAAEYAADQTAAIQKYVTRTAQRLFPLIAEDSAEAVSKLLSVCKIKLDELEAWISHCTDGAHPNMLAVLMEYKNQHFTPQEADALVQKQADIDLGIQERSLAEWKKIFKFKEVDGAICITGYKSQETVVCIPPAIDGKPVRLIHDKAFQDCATITEVVIPAGVSAIGKNAFANCSGLTEITLPNSVATIGNGAFSGCGIEKIVIPEGVVTLGWYAFSHCEKLTGICLPESLQEIGPYAFLLCEALESIRIPDGVKKIGNDAFSGCFNLVNVTLPDAPAKIGARVFDRCEKLEEVTIPRSVKLLDGWAFSECKKLKRVTFAGAKTKIGVDILCHCSGVELHGPAGSCAETYAKENNIPFVAE